MRSMSSDVLLLKLLCVEDPPVAEGGELLELGDRIVSPVACLWSSGCGRLAPKGVRLPTFRGRECSIRLAFVPQQTTSGELRALGPVRQSFASEHGWQWTVADPGGLRWSGRSSYRDRSFPHGKRLDAQTCMVEAEGEGFEPLRGLHL
jgi:hypothetical protein